MKKEKNYMLASLGIVTGICSALASVLMPISPWVKVKLTSSSINFVCQRLGVSCDTDGDFTCRVRVTVTMSGSNVSKTINGHLDQTCVVVAKKIIPGTEVSSLVVYDAVN